MGTITRSRKLFTRGVRNHRLSRHPLTLTKRNNVTAPRLSTARQPRRIGLARRYILYTDYNGSSIMINGVVMAWSSGVSAGVIRAQNGCHTTVRGANRRIQ